MALMCQPSTVAVVAGQPLKRQFFLQEVNLCAAVAVWVPPDVRPCPLRYMKSYSPVDNVKAQAYPNILVTAGLHDPRVGYWEPAKLVARLRELKTDSNLLLLKTEMGAGHFSVTGRCVGVVCGRLLGSQQLFRDKDHDRQ